MSYCWIKELSLDTAVVRYNVRWTHKKYFFTKCFHTTVTKSNRMHKKRTSFQTHKQFKTTNSKLLLELYLFLGFQSFYRTILKKKKKTLKNCTKWVVLESPVRYQLDLTTELLHRLKQRVIRVLCRVPIACMQRKWQLAARTNGNKKYKSLKP